MYAGDMQALFEQRFDRKLWEVQMGGENELMGLVTGIAIAICIQVFNEALNICLSS